MARECQVGHANQLDSLRRFGIQAETQVQPSVAVGGFVVPGDVPAAGPTLPAEVTPKYVQQGAGPARKAGASAASAAPRASAEAGEAARSVGALSLRASGAREFVEFAGLAELYPDFARAASSTNFDIFTLRLGLFYDLPYRARLFLEVPDLSLARQYPPSIIPPVRAWAFWDLGPETGLQITSHHENPDGSICACMPEDWIRGRDLIVDYVNFCVCWIAKTLHDQLIGFYPGLQHLPEYLRRRRNRPGEFCGCSAPRRYRDCHRDADLRLDEGDLCEQRRETNRRYFAQLGAQRRLSNPLQLIGRVVSPNVA